MAINKQDEDSIQIVSDEDDDMSDSFDSSS